MDWDAADALDVVQALAAHFGFGFAEAVDFLLARQLQQAQNDDGEAQQHPQPQDDEEEEEEVGDAEQWEDSEDEHDGVIMPMLGHELVTMSATVGSGEEGFQDGAAAEAKFSGGIYGMLCLPDGCVLVADTGNNRIRLLSADLQEVSTVAGDGEEGHRDGAAAQARFAYPTGLALLPDGRVLVVDEFNHCIRLLSADLQEVSTVAGDGEGGTHTFSPQEGALF